MSNQGKLTFLNVDCRLWLRLHKVMADVIAPCTQNGKITEVWREKLATLE